MSKKIKLLSLLGVLLVGVIVTVVTIFSFTGNARLQYTVHVPTVADTEQMLPLMIVLHNEGTNGEVFEEQTSLRELGREENFITVFPNSDKSGWNNGLDDAVTVDDVKYIENIILDMKEKYNIDNSRIFVVGFAEGGSLAYRLGCELSEYVTGVGSVGGNGSVGSFACDGLPVSYIQIHGEKDNVNPLQGEVGGGDAYSSSNLGVEAYLNKNSCTNSMVTETPVLVTETWGSCKNGSAVKFVKVLDKGHEWFAGGGVDAENMLWDFLNSHPRR